MEAVILAAGLGRRLRPYTETTPKPLLLVQGRPILDWIIGALPAEVNRLLVVVNYLAEQIEAYLARQRRIDDWQTVMQPAPRGTGDAFRACRPLLHGDRYLVLNADDLYGAADLKRLTAHQAAVLAHPVAEPRQFGIVFLRADGSLDRIEEKPDIPGPQLANIGAYVFPRSVFEIELTQSPRGEYEITEYVGRLARQQRFAVVQAGFWLPIGDMAAWRAAETADLSAARASQ